MFLLTRCCFFFLDFYCPNPNPFLPIPHRRKWASPNIIYNITQDKQDFLWFGTLNGLARYDGNNFENYSFEDDSGLKGRRVDLVEEDKYGNLWVVSVIPDVWLQVYNPKSDSFHTIDSLNGDTI